MVRTLKVDRETAEEAFGEPQNYQRQWRADP